MTVATATVGGMKVVDLTDEPLSGIPYHRREIRAWQRDQQSDWYMGIRFLRGGGHVAGEYEYTIRSGRRDYSLDWN